MCGMAGQERQKRGEEWAPRWFAPAGDKTVHAGEATQEECPMFDFTGTYLNRHPQLAALSPEGACASCVLTCALLTGCLCMCVLVLEASSCVLVAMRM